AQQFRIAGRIDVARPPLTVDVPTVPHFDRVRAFRCHATDISHVPFGVTAYSDTLRLVHDDQHNAEAVAVCLVDHAGHAARIVARFPDYLLLDPRHARDAHPIDGLAAEAQHVAAEIEAADRRGVDNRCARGRRFRRCRGSGITGG